MRTHFTTARQSVMPTHISYLTALRYIGVITMLLIILPLASATAGQVGDKDFLLDCTFEKYNNNTNYSPKFAKAWIPPLQKHRIDGDQILFQSYYDKLKGTITKRNDERIEWTYLERPKDKHGKPYDAKRIYSYFFTTNKIASRMEFGTGYTHIGYVWGTCDEIVNGKNLTGTTDKASKTDAQKKDKKYKQLLPINMNDWRTIRGSNGSVLKYHNTHDAILFTSTNPWFKATHAKLARSPKADLRYAIYWANENVFDLKGYKHFNYGKPDKILATAYKGIKYIMVLDPDLDRIHDNRKTFMQFSMRFKNSGEWFSNDTTLK